MSDARSVGFDTRGASVIRAMADTANMTAPERAAYWLEKITERIHRGARRDTWTSARDCAAELIEIKPSMAKRIWQRRQDMKFVDGDAATKLLEAYELMHIWKAASDEERQAIASSGRLAKFISALAATDDR